MREVRFVRESNYFADRVYPAVISMSPSDEIEKYSDMQSLDTLQEFSPEAV